MTIKNRARSTVTANGQTVNIGHTDAEAATMTSDCDTILDDQGRMVSRAEGMGLTLRRTLNRRDARLALLQVAILSQKFNLLARSRDAHPALRVEEQAKQGNQWVTEFITNLRDFQPTGYELSWTGEGAQGLNGLTITEELRVIGLEGDITSTIDGLPVPFNFKQ